MKPVLLIPLLLLAGFGVGGGAAAGVQVLFPPSRADAAPAGHAADTGFVPTGRILTPLVFANGRLAGYVAFEVQLEAADGDIAFVTARLPLLLNAINMRTFRTPMTSGPDGMLPDLATFQKIVMESASEAFGPRIVRRAAIMQATPA